MVEKKVEIEGAGLSRRDPARNSVSGGGVDVENGGMATHLVPNWGDLGSVGVPAPARTPLGPLGPKMGPHFPAKSAEILELSSIFGLPGILHRIHRIHYFPPDPPETRHSQQNGPWVPHAEEQDDGSLHKLLQISFIAHSL